ncbi:MAG: flagellar biosynthetic protein FliR [Hyphomonadaceae bacterium]
MPADFLDPAFLADWIGMFVLIVARLSVVIFLMPGIGEQVVPINHRALLMIGIATAFAGAGVVTPVSFTPISGFLSTIFAELWISFMLGVSLRLVIWVLSIVGSVIAQTIGLAQFIGVALQFEAQTITANLLAMAGATLLLSVDYHITAIGALLRLYETVPVGAYASFDPGFVVDGFFAGFRLAITLAWPFVAVNLIYNICLGFINKALPQLMVAFVGAPFMVGAGMIFFTVSIGGLLVVWRSQLPELIGWL